MRSERATAASFGEGAGGGSIPDARTVVVDTVVDDERGDVTTVPGEPHPAASRANATLTTNPATERRIVISRMHMQLI
ncbi:MAG: hypothetical protein ACLPVY_27665 [Acidimicrobiia bacterium]